MFEPKNLKRWTMPDSYFGATWPNHYSAGVGQSRDSDCLEQSNFAAMIKLLGGESAIITIVRASHWAVGWVEWIAIEADGTAESDKALQLADAAKERLADYPVLAQVIFVPGDGGGYAVKNPKLYGLNDHDATYRYVWVPENIVNKESKCS